LLRGINVGTQKRVSMQTLKELYSSLGYEDVRTYVQSGNVVFSAKGNNSYIKDRLEKEIQLTFGFGVLVFIRDRKEFATLVKNSPFKSRDETKLHVTFLSEKPSSVPVADLNSAKSGAEDFLLSGKEIYLFCPNGYGVTKLSNSFFERKLKVSATTRNWRTVNTLLELLSG
jgi:uncharacterized protein (DUF1697 family)